MAYEPGTYTRELRTEHQRGEHAEQENDDCPACSFQVVPEGFTSLAEFKAALWEGALDLQFHVDAHARGRAQVPVRGCVYRMQQGEAVLTRVIGSPSVVSCPVCGNVVKIAAEWKLPVHFGRELSVKGYRSTSCKASRLTPVEARELARREAEELDALRRRPHP